MATKVTPKEIEYFNEVYAACHSYTQTAKICGRAASTIKKYIDPAYKPAQQVNIDTDTIELPPLEEIAEIIPPWYDITCLTPKEEKEIKILWAEMLV